MKTHPPTGLTATGLTVGFPDTKLIVDASFSVASGESVALMGRSGCGKSTLLWNLMGLIRPLAGEVTVDGCQITGVSARRQAEIRRTRMGVVFQRPQLISELTAVENVMTPLLIRGLNRKESFARSESILLQMGVPLRDSVAQLSGGEQQRVSIARALVDTPQVVIADEPTAALDEETADEVIESLLALARDRDAAVLLVTHSSKVAARADRHLVVQNQQITGGRRADL